MIIAINNDRCLIQFIPNSTVIYKNGTELLLFLPKKAIIILIAIIRINWRQNTTPIVLQLGYINSKMLTA